MLVETLWALVALLLLVALWALSRYKPLSRRHRRNITNSRKLLGRLRSFQGQGRNPRILAYLRKINPFLFEELLLTAFESIGYEVVRNRRYTGDGGVDGYIVVNGYGKIPIQAKRYKRHINRQHISDFIPHAQRAGCGLFVHTGKTGAQARETVRRCQCVRVLSGGRLVALVDGVDPLAGMQDAQASGPHVGGRRGGE